MISYYAIIKDRKQQLWRDRNKTVALTTATNTKRTTLVGGKALSYYYIYLISMVIRKKHNTNETIFNAKKIQKITHVAATITMVSS